MRGYPKHLNSMRDYLYVLENHPEMFPKAIEDLKTTAYMWIPTGEVASVEAGINDTTHRVDRDDQNNKFIQNELVINPGGQFFRIGFTEEDLDKPCTDIRSRLGADEIIVPEE